LTPRKMARNFDFPLENDVKTETSESGSFGGQNRTLKQGVETR